MVDSSISLDQKLFENMVDHASSTYPEECCGLLVGKLLEGNAVKKVMYVRAVDNVSEKSVRSHSYTIDPKEYLSIEIEAEKSDLEVIGVFHSHPNAAASPSAIDRNYAWPGLSYVVIGVREGKSVEVASWTIEKLGGDFHEERIIIEAHKN